MTRKDYELIAGAISNLDEVTDEYTIEAIAEMFADSLANTNPNFNRDRFIARATATDSKRRALLVSLGIA